MYFHKTGTATDWQPLFYWSHGGKIHTHSRDSISTKIMEGITRARSTMFSLHADFISSWCWAAKRQFLWWVLHAWPGRRSTASHATQCSRQQKLLVRLRVVQQVIHWTLNEPLQSRGSFNSFPSAIHSSPLEHLCRMLPLWSGDSCLLCEARRSDVLQLP